MQPASPELHAPGRFGARSGTHEDPKALRVNSDVIGLRSDSGGRDTEPRDPAAAVAWRPTLLALGAGALSILVVYSPTILSMVDKWSHSQTYAHGFLIAPISAYLAWTRRRELARIVPSPNPWGIAALAALSLLWVLGWAVNANVIEQLSVVLMIPALVVAIAGSETARALLFPLGYLLFAVPIGDELVPTLTEFTARFTIDAIRAVGVPAVREGFFLHIPGQTWEVTKACSGVRYLIASLAVGCIFAYVQFRSWRLRLAFISLAAVVPVLANGIRAFLIVILGYVSNGRLATGVDHLIYGWIFFGIVMMLLLWFGSTWRESMRAGGSGPSAPAVPPRAGRPATATIATCTAIAVALPVVTLLAEQALNHVIGSRVIATDLRAPAGAEGWHGPEETSDDWRPHFESPAEEIRQVYSKGEDRVQFFAAVYGRQRQRAELISALNRVYDPKGWRRTEERVRDLPIDHRVVRVIETDLSRVGPVGGERHRLAWHWYVVAGEPTTNAYVAKILELKALLMGRRDPSMAIAIAADYAARPEQAAAVLEDYLRANRAALHRTVAWRAVATRERRSLKG